MRNEMGTIENKQDDVVIITIEDELNLMTAEAVKEVFEKNFKLHNKKIIVDFSQTDFLDSTGIGLIIEMTNRLRQAGGNLAIIRMNRDVKNLFGIANLLDILTHYENLEDAINYFTDLKK